MNRRRFLRQIPSIGAIALGAGFFVETLPRISTGRLLWDDWIQLAISIGLILVGGYFFYTRPLFPTIGIGTAIVLIHVQRAYEFSFILDTVEAGSPWQQLLSRTSPVELFPWSLFSYVGGEEVWWHVSWFISTQLIGIGFLCFLVGLGNFFVDDEAKTPTSDVED